MNKSKSNYLKIMLDLTRELNHHNTLYYEKNTPEITDREFDEKLFLLKKYEAKYPRYRQPDSPTLKVGGQAIIGHNEPHTIKMLSLNNAFNKQDLLNFNIAISKITEQPDNEYCCELKIDGLSIALQYNNHILQQALTRGDGIKGNNVTQNILTINNLPRNIKIENAIVHGEVYLSKSKFKKINHQRIINKQKKFINTRNAAAGSLSLHDTDEVKNRYLQIFLYYWFNLNTAQNGDDQSTQIKSLNLLKRFGFPLAPDYQLCSNIKEVCDFIHQIEQKREQYDFEIDGIVIKLNQKKWWYYLGSTNKAPRWAIAYKFSEQTKTTILKNISISVGRTGKITYIGWLSPIMLSGTIIQKVSLHNFDNIQALKLKIGDQVLVKKAGDIIPQIINRISGQTNTNKLFSKIQFCPSCKHKLFEYKKYVDQYCTNPDCEEQIILKINYFASKNGLDIKTISYKILKKLYKANFVKSIPDLLFLERNKLKICELFGMGLKRVDILIKNIEQAKTRPATNVLTALGISHVGKRHAEILLNSFHSIEKLSHTTLNDLINIQNIQALTANKIVDFFQKPVHKNLLKTLKKQGFQFKKQSIETKSSSIDHKRFVITGKLTRTRTFYTNLISQNFGLNQNTVNSKTDYLICNQIKSWSKKILLAQDYNVKIINESDFMKLLNVKF